MRQPLETFSPWAYAWILVGLAFPLTWLYTPYILIGLSLGYLYGHLFFGTGILAGLITGCALTALGSRLGDDVTIFTIIATAVAFYLAAQVPVIPAVSDYIAMRRCRHRGPR